MWEDLKELVSAIVQVGAVVLSVVMGVLVFALSVMFSYNHFVAKPDCVTYGATTKQEVFYSNSTSCLVKVDDKWFSYRDAFGSKQEITIKNR